MSEVEWSVVVAVAVAGLLWILVGRALAWRRERMREPMRAPFRLQPFSGPEEAEGRPAPDVGPGGRRQHAPVPRPERAEPLPVLAAPDLPEEPVAQSRAGAPSPVVAMASVPSSLKSAPEDLCPENLPEEPPPAGIEAAESQLRQLQQRLERERARMEQLTEASGEELARALLRHGADSVAGLPPAAALRVRQQAEALQRLAEELELMERNVKRKALELVDLRRVLRRSTESGWGRKLEA